MPIMNFIFEVIDKTGRKIHLTYERWFKHIKPEHPEIQEPEELINVLQNADKITESDRDLNVNYYYKYNKLRRKYLKVAVKYLNGIGYVITTHYITKIE